MRLCTRVCEGIEPITSFCNFMQSNDIMFFISLIWCSAPSTLCLFPVPDIYLATTCFTDTKKKAKKAYNAPEHTRCKRGYLPSYPHLHPTCMSAVEGSQTRI